MTDPTKQVLVLSITKADFSTEERRIRGRAAALAEWRTASAAAAERWRGNWRDGARNVSLYHLGRLQAGWCTFTPDGNGNPSVVTPKEDR